MTDATLWWTVFGGVTFVAYLVLLETGLDRRSPRHPAYHRQLRWLALLAGPVGWGIMVAVVVWQIVRTSRRAR